MSDTPDWALPLCPNCGTWGQGKPVEIVDLECRVSAAYVISRGARHSEVLANTNKHRITMGKGPLPDNWPEPIDWKLAATLRYPIDDQKEWVMRTAEERA